MVVDVYTVLNSIKGVNDSPIEPGCKRTEIIPFQLPTAVHKDVTERLTQINPSLADRARVVLDLNKSERHIRGGMATKEKYLHKAKYN